MNALIGFNHFYTLLMLGVVLLGCTSQTFEMPEAQGSTPNEAMRSAVATFPVGATPTGPSQSRFSCAFLLEPRESVLLESVHSYETVAAAITEIYALSDGKVNINIARVTDGTSHFYEWFTTEPFLGMTYHRAIGTEHTLLNVDSFSYEATPPAFMLRDVFDCLGIPSGSTAFPTTIDTSNVERYGEPVNGLSLFYRDRNLVFNVAWPFKDEFLSENTKVYFVGVEFYPVETTDPTTQSIIDHYIGDFQTWPPANWLHTS